MSKESFKLLVERSIANTSIPSSITKIGKSAFSYCKSMLKITIPSNITILEDDCFSYSGITSIVIPSSISSMGSRVFQSCSTLVKATMLNGVTSIGASAFNNCTMLQDIEIASTVSTIGNLAFGSVGTSSTAARKTTIVFNQPSGMAVSLPTAGSSNGMLYAKTSREMTIYTDNETIKNYAYATDNVTATIYHLDGSAWE